MTAQLRLVREAPVRDLLPAGSPDRLEASGVIAAAGRFYVIFDNVRAVAVIDEDLDRVDRNTMVPTGPHDRQAYEDIARDPVSGHLYLLIEAARRDGDQLARVEEYDRELRFLSAGWLEFPLPEPNKGIEGLDCVHRDGVTYLLGLCEGNRAEGGAAGRRPGGGRVEVFRRGRRNWKHHATVRLPESLWFTDYSSISIVGDRVAVVSQESSALWLGTLLPSTWDLAGPGRTYLFPRDPDGDIAYCTVEGVCWRTDDEFVVVSDRAKPDMHDRGCRAKAESLHIFALPQEAAGHR
jgi:hypothetical protein